MHVERERICQRMPLLSSSSFSSSSHELPRDLIRRLEGSRGDSQMRRCDCRTSTSHNERGTALPTNLRTCDVVFTVLESHCWRRRWRIFIYSMHAVFFSLSLLGIGVKKVQVLRCGTKKPRGVFVFAGSLVAPEQKSSTADSPELFLKRQTVVHFPPGGRAHLRSRGGSSG